MTIRFLRARRCRRRRRCHVRWKCEIKISAEYARPIWRGSCNFTHGEAEARAAPRSAAPRHAQPHTIATGKLILPLPPPRALVRNRVWFSVDLRVRSWCARVGELDGLVLEFTGRRDTRAEAATITRPSRRKIHLDSQAWRVSSDQTRSARISHFDYVIRRCYDAFIPQTYRGRAGNAVW